MTPNSMPLDALLGYVSNSDQDTLREILEHTRQALIEAEAAAVVGAQPHERTEGRVGHRNGHRPRTVDSRVGRLELEIPKLRQRSFLPGLLEPRRRIERALWVVIQEAWVHGVSTRKVDDLVAAMGGCHVSKSEVSRICLRAGTVPGPAAGRRPVPVRLVRRHLREGAPGWPDCEPGGGGGDWGEGVRGEVRSGGGRGCQRDRGLLARVLPLFGGSRAARRAAGYLGCP